MTDKLRKTSMFSDGTVVAEGKGGMVKASPEEIKTHLASLLPGKYKGEALEQVMYNKEDGCVYGKYASKKIKRQVHTAQAVNKTEPVDGVQKSKDTNVPRNEKKSKPEIDTGDKSVKNPTEVRTKEYKRGPGGEDLHSGIPRSQSDGGLKGGSVEKASKETADTAKSGNPDTYVQDFTASETPAKAGSEMNHAAGTEIEFKQADQIYTPLTLAKKDDDKDEAKDDCKNEKDCDDNKDSKKDKKSKLPWEKDNSDNDEKKKDVEAGILQGQIKEAKTTIQELETKISNHKVEMVRRTAATKYALAMLKMNPARYAEAEAFNELIANAASKMTKEAIESATEAIEDARKETQDAVKTASVQTEVEDSGLATAIVIPGESAIKTAGAKEGEELKDILLSGTRFGRMMDDFDDYTPHTR